MIEINNKLNEIELKIKQEFEQLDKDYDDFCYDILFNELIKLTRRKSTKDSLCLTMEIWLL